MTDDTYMLSIILFSQNLVFCPMVYHVFRPLNTLSCVLMYLSFSSCTADIVQHIMNIFLLSHID